MLLLLCLSTSAQQDTAMVINGAFSTSGTMDAYCDTGNLDDARTNDEGCKWTLMQDADGVIKFWINHPKVGMLNVTTWDDCIILFQIMDGLLSYIVADRNFRHLYIGEYEKGKFLVNYASVYTPTE